MRDHRKTNLIKANAVDRARDVDNPRVNAGYSELLEPVESVYLPYSHSCRKSRRNHNGYNIKSFQDYITGV